MIAAKKAAPSIGDFRGNFMRGRGDYMGVARSLNDNADVTAPVFSYWPNDYGLYNMAGNVSEWVMDVYRPLSPEDVNDLQPFRGNVFKTKVLNSDGSIAGQIRQGDLRHRRHQILAH
jgi:formylglycine-generating enzyme required for sulfatase activity